MNTSRGQVSAKVAMTTALEALLASGVGSGEVITRMFDVNAGGLVPFTDQHRFAVVSAVPGTATVLELPTNPTQGETVGFWNADGSCNATHPIEMAALVPGQNILGSTAGIWTQPWAAAFATWDQATATWVVLGTPSTVQTLASSFGVMSGNVSLTTTNPTIIAHAAITCRVSGVVLVSIRGVCVGDATGGNVTLSISHGGAATPADFTGQAVTVPVNSSVSCGLELNLFQQASVRLALNTAVQVNAVATANAANHLSFAAPSGMTIELTEMDSDG